MSRSNAIPIERFRAERAEAPARLDSGGEVRQVRTAPPTVLLPRPLVYTPGEGKTVSELQRLIEDALAALAGRSGEHAEMPAPHELDGIEAEAPALGPASGSAVRHNSSATSRIVKTVLGLVAALFIAVLPLRNVLTPTSTEAFVNAPLLTILAPATGTFVGTDLAAGERVGRRDTLGLVEAADGSGRVPIITPGAGKIWDILAQPGSDVARGQDLLRVVACSAASVTAAVSATVYDRLSPGMAARFRFYGGDRVYPGTVANLLGRAAGATNLAISPAGVDADAYRVTVSVPDLGEIPNCAVGRRGEVIFEPSRG